MTVTSGNTMRLIFPQWQGGNNPTYHFGTELLNWLAPEASGPVETVAVMKPDNVPLQADAGIVARQELLNQADDARRLIEKHQPDRLVVLGGDCLVDLSPFAYLNERYDGDLAILWVDTHPDLITPKESSHGHTMVLGNLLGEGDPEFTARVKRPIKPSNVMFAGRRDTSNAFAAIQAKEIEMLSRLGLRTAGPEALANSSDPVLEWLRSTGAKHLAIHLDLDVLDPTLFRSLLFSNPDPSVPSVETYPSGRMTMEQIVRLLGDVSKVVDVVGLGITEHLPWDSLALKNMLAELPLIGRPVR
ncbi:arginase family protein [Xanthomonas campestris]|uniref:arginase family protein n=1 Tax=Xanthomonas campestris TaxID=339 RepID=UPI002378D6F3|nr:arginase family protein [Xanthomonas campestris]WDK01728.1 arginase family protein [Xanthomonas campestris]